jgi:phosphatidylserine decarboxylase
MPPSSWLKARLIVKPRPGGYLPADNRVHRQWLQNQVDHVDSNPKELLPVLQEFKDMIEGNARIYMYFREMWDEIPRRPPYTRDPTGKSQIRDYHHMLAVLNHVFTRAPEWTDAAEAAGMVGVPMCAIFDYAMGTPSGHAAFLDPDVNKMLKKVLNEWGKFLKVSFHVTLRNNASMPVSTYTPARRPNPQKS